MAEVLSSVITNLQSKPVVAAQSWEQRAPLLVSIGSVEAAAAQAANDVLRFFRISSSERLVDLLLQNDTAATAGNIHIGLHRTTADGGAVVDADFFATAVAITTGRVVPTSILFEATGANIDKWHKRIWELLGLTTDPMIVYDLTATVSTLFNAGAAMTIAIEAHTVK